MRDEADNQSAEKAGSIDIAVENSVGWVVFNNPDRHNALSQAMWRDLPEKFAALATNPNVRVIVLRGAGEKAFCAGADISEFDTVRKNATSARQYEDENVRAFAAIRECEKPVIAMIHGHCLGGGFGIAAAADLRLAEMDASFAVPAARLGLAYPIDAMVDIVRSAGDQTAREMLYCARKFTASEMLQRGFLLEASDKEQLLERVLKITAQIVENAPQTLRATKLTLRGLQTGNMEAANTQAAATFESQDYAEGRAAFREKRKPEFTGK